MEARSAWEGFLWSPRLYRPLMEVLKPAFLDTANHYAQLGRHREQYASLLTFVGLDAADVFGRRSWHWPRKHCLKQRWNMPQRRFSEQWIAPASSGPTTGGTGRPRI